MLFPVIFFYFCPNQSWNFVTKMLRYWSFLTITGHRAEKVLLMKFEILGLVGVQEILLHTRKLQTKSNYCLAATCMSSKQWIFLLSFTLDTAKNCLACWISPAFLQVKAAILYWFRLVAKSSIVLVFSDSGSWRKASTVTVIF